MNYEVIKAKLPEITLLLHSALVLVGALCTREYCEAANKKEHNL